MYQFKQVHFLSFWVNIRVSWPWLWSLTSMFATIKSPLHSLPLLLNELNLHTPPTFSPSTNGLIQPLKFNPFIIGLIFVSSTQFWCSFTIDIYITRGTVVGVYMSPPSFEWSNPQKLTSTIFIHSAIVPTIVIWLHIHHFQVWKEQNYYIFFSVIPPNQGGLWCWHVWKLHRFK